MEFAVDAAVDRVLQDRVDEGTVGLVHLPQLHNGLGHIVRVGVQEHLGERGLAAVRPLVGQVQAVEDLLHTGRGPRLYVHTTLVLDVGLELCHALPQEGPGLLSLVEVNADATHPHIDQDFGKGLLDLEDGL